MVPAPDAERYDVLDTAGLLAGIATAPPSAPGAPLAQRSVGRREPALRHAVSFDFGVELPCVGGVEHALDVVSG